MGAHSSARHYTAYRSGEIRWLSTCNSFTNSLSSAAYRLHTMMSTDDGGRPQRTVSSVSYAPSVRRWRIWWTFRTPLEHVVKHNGRNCASQSWSSGKDSQLGVWCGSLREDGGMGRSAVIF